MTKANQRSFTCELCQGTFQSEQPDEEAQAEALREWGRRGNTPGMAVICDDCYRRVMDWWRQGRAMRS